MRRAKKKETSTEKEQHTGKNLALALVMIGFGCVLMLFPETSVESIYMILGIGLLVAGAVGLLRYFIERRKGREAELSAKCIIMVLAGVLMLVRPQVVIAALPVLIGILFVINGITAVTAAVNAVAMVSGTRKLILILALMTIIFGCLMVFDPFGTVRAFAILCGLDLVLTGIVALFERIEQQ